MPKYSRDDYDAARLKATRERCLKIVKLRNNGQTFVQMGKTFGLSAARVGQLYHRGVRVLRYEQENAGL